MNHNLIAKAKASLLAINTIDTVINDDRFNAVLDKWDGKCINKNFNSQLNDVVDEIINQSNNGMYITISDNLGYDVDDKDLKIVSRKPVSDESGDCWIYPDYYTTVTARKITTDGKRINSESIRDALKVENDSAVLQKKSLSKIVNNFNSLVEQYEKRKAQIDEINEQYMKNVPSLFSLVFPLK